MDHEPPIQRLRSQGFWLFFVCFIHSTQFAAAGNWYLMKSVYGCCLPIIYMRKSRVKASGHVAQPTCVDNNRCECASVKPFLRFTLAVQGTCATSICLFRPVNRFRVVSVCFSTHIYPVMRMHCCKGPLPNRQLLS